MRKFELEKIIKENTLYFYTLEYSNTHKVWVTITLSLSLSLCLLSFSFNYSLSLSLLSFYFTLTQSFSTYVSWSLKLSHYFAFSFILSDIAKVSHGRSEARNNSSDWVSIKGGWVKVKTVSEEEGVFFKT